jgi:type II secretory pathway predicted ATPase ExeA/septal ring-binding cell division protein DamX
MYLKHFHLNYLPFANEPDPEIFFQGSGEGKVLQQLIEDFISGKPLVRVTGEEGTGKTQLCQCLLRQPLGRHFDLVYLENPVGSLNDLLYGVCVDLGMTAPVSSGHDMLAELQQLLHQRKGNGKKVLLIIDEAEKLFLAALERLMRVICESGEDHILHVLLVGRPTLAEHLDQLTAYCSDVDILSGYTLSRLTREETGDYLYFRLTEAGSEENNLDAFFSQQAVEKMYSASGGNIRRINQLADSAMQAACDIHSPLVLPEHVESWDDKPRARSVRLKRTSPALTRKNGVIAGSLLVLCLVLFFLFSGDEDNKIEDIVAIPEQPVEAQQIREPEVVIPEIVESQVPVARQSEVEAEEPQIKVIEDPLVAEPEPEVVETKEPEFIELRPERVKVSPGTIEQKIIIIEPPSKTPVAKTPVEPVKQIRVSPLGEQIFQERIRASAKWLANGYHNRYTVQMMMLASEQAAPNVKRMLAQQEYQAIKDYLYILTKKTSPPTLFVFYGTYDSMEQARQARNNMPLFLRKHHPYALSINDAMKKTED